MEEYIINDGYCRNIYITKINKHNNHVLVYKINDYNSISFLTEYYYKNIHILKDCLGTNLLINIWDNIYIHIYYKGIFIFESINKILYYYNVSHNEETEDYVKKNKVCAIDSDNNVYLFEPYWYIIACDTVISRDFKMYELEDYYYYFYNDHFLIGNYEYDNVVYDLYSGKIFMNYDGNKIKKDSDTKHLPIKNTDKLYDTWKQIVKSDNIDIVIAYPNNDGEYVDLNKESLKKLNEGFMLNNSIYHIKKTKLKDQLYLSNINMSCKYKRLSLCGMFLLIKEYAKKNKLLIPKCIICEIIKYYRDYYNKYVMISQCSEIIKMLDNVSSDLMEMASYKYPSALRFLNNDIQQKISKELIKEFPQIIKYVNDQNDELSTNSLKYNGNTIKHIKNPSLEHYTESIKNNVNNVVFHKIIHYENELIKNALSKLPEHILSNFIVVGDSELFNILLKINPNIIKLVSF